MKVSVIMPTYNDGDTIEAALNSLLKQTYSNWELIIVDDGSTDNTYSVINDYISKHDKENRIKYFYQENADQLNAIITALNYVTGDYIYVLHSDDLLNEKNTLKKCVEFMDAHNELDAIISDINIINDKGELVGVQKVDEYRNTIKDLPLQELWLGRNLYTDVGFFRKNVYKSSVKNTYLTWNMPFWIKSNSHKLGILNVKKVDFIFMKYRVGNNNYINSDLGKLNVINGELRTLTTIMNNYCIPFYRTQYILFRICHKLNLQYTPYYLEKEQNNKATIIKFAIKKRFGNSYKDNIFLNALVNYYANNSSRRIKLKQHIKNNIIYQGKDICKFNKNLLDGNLEKFYINFLKEMNKGFSTIIVENKTEKEKITNICKFLCIYPKIITK